mmetsp:Transcript_79741/g.151427  ORF Transcript_79741/g.151427 Transcript_79741/m.151427 type:complete len:363 (-) Transcript_79741:189-1277(-)
MVAKIPLTAGACEVGAMLVGFVLFYFAKIGLIQIIPITLIGFGLGLAIQRFLGRDLNERKIEDKVEELKDTWKVKSALGLKDDPAKLFKNHVSSLKYFLFFLLIGRFCINMKALYGNFAKLWTKDLPANLESVAQAFEGGFFIAFLLIFLSNLANAALGIKRCRWECVENFKNLAGYSSLRFLAFLDVSYLSKTWTKNTHNAPAPLLVLFGISFLISIIIYGTLGMAVLLGKIAAFDINNIQSMGVTGTIVEFCSALQAGNFGGLMQLNFVQLAMFANQVASFNSAETLEFERLLTYIFARGDSKYDTEEEDTMKGYKEMLAVRLMLLPNWRTRLVAMMTFGPDDLQKLTIEDKKREGLLDA